VLVSPGCWASKEQQQQWFTSRSAYLLPRSPQIEMWLDAADPSGPTVRAQIRLSGLGQAWTNGYDQSSGNPVYTSGRMPDFISSLTDRRWPTPFLSAILLLSSCSGYPTVDRPVFRFFGRPPAYYRLHCSRPLSLVRQRLPSSSKHATGKRCQQSSRSGRASNPSNGDSNLLNAVAALEQTGTKGRWQLAGVLHTEKPKAKRSQS
jgi:hypothetical protein